MAEVTTEIERRITIWSYALLNAESKQDADLVAERIDELRSLLAWATKQQKGLT